MGVSPTELLLIEQACRRVVLDSALAVDRQNYAELARLFTPEGVLVRPDGSRLQGRQQIEQAYASRDPDRLTRHVITNHLIDPLDATRVQSLCTVLLWTGRHSAHPTTQGRPADALQLLGEFEDDLVLDAAEGWRIRQRQARFVLHYPA